MRHSVLSVVAVAMLATCAAGAEDALAEATDRTAGPDRDTLLAQEAIPALERTITDVGGTTSWERPKHIEEMEEPSGPCDPH